MGANARTSSSTQYFQTFKGDIVQRVSAETPGAIPRVMKNEKTVYELHFGSLTGWLRDFYISITELENKAKLITLNIILSDENGIMKLGIPHRSSMATAFYYKIANVNLNHKVDIHSGFISDEEKAILWMKQGGQLVESYFSKDNLPAPEQITEKDSFGNDVEKWSYKKREAFLNNWLKDEMLPKLHTWHSEAVELVRDQQKLDPQVLSTFGEKEEEKDLSTAHGVYEKEEMPKELASPPIDETDMDDLPF